MILLALDLSRHLGVAHGSGRPILATYHLPKVEGDGVNGFDFGPAFAEFWRTLEGLCALVKPERLAFEAPLMPRGGNFYTPEVTVRLLMGLAALTETFAQLNDIPCDERNVATVKLFWSGHGRADKQAMVARCRQLGFTPRNDNEADACGLFHLVMAEYDPGFSPQSTPLFGRAAE